MSQKLTILFDLDGTLADTAPDLLSAHNHVMKKFGYDTKNIDEIRNYLGQGAAIMIGKSIWSSAKRELSKITDQKVKNEMIKEFLDFYGKNTVVKSKLINGVYEFLKWAKANNISIILQKKNVVLAKTDLNITNKIIDILNSKIESINLN